MCDTNVLGKRATLKRTRPNPLFQGWLEELYDEAKKSKSKLENMLKVSLDSLSKYPLPLKTGADCIILKGFKKQLCQHLDQRLQIYNSNQALTEAATQSVSSARSSSTDSQSRDESSNDVVMNSIPKPENNTPSNSDAVLEQQDMDANSNKNAQNYKPAFRSGPYAILRVLYEQHQTNPSESQLTKEELIINAQVYSEENFARPKPESYFTAWSNMTQLMTKGLVKKIGSKKIKYQLTKKGLQLAGEIIEYYENIPRDNDFYNNAHCSTSNKEERGTNVENEEVISVSSSSQSSQKFDETVIEFSPNCFDVILLIDKNETRGASRKNDPTVNQFRKYYDLNHEYRNLKVGDFTWIARHQVHKELELVLPYIIERKRMDDFGASIKDGRFQEQKFRLRKCSIPNVIYLVENYGKNKHVGLPVQSLHQAMSNTRVQDGFKVHLTDSLRNSARFLAMITRCLIIKYKDKALQGRNAEANDEFLMTFDYFNKASMKTKVLTVTETFIKVLLQLKGMTLEKALAITNKYSTPKSLIIAYRNCEPDEGEYLLADLQYNEVSRNVGHTVSKAIYQLFSSIETG